MNIKICSSYLYGIVLALCLIMARKSRLPGPDILRLDCESGLMQSQIAEKYNVPATFVSKKLRLYGLKSKSHFENPEYNKRLSDSLKEKYKDPDYKIRVMAPLKVFAAKPNAQELMSKIQKEIWQNPELIEMHSKKMIEVCNTNEYKAKLSEKMSQINSNLEYRTKQSKILKGIKGTEENKLKQSETSKKMWQKEEYKEKMAIVRSMVANTLTKPHQTVCYTLDSLNIKYENEFILGLWTFDIFIPSKNLLIEVQGDYWHSLPDVKIRDIRKLDYIKNNFPQYQLKYIWEHDTKDNDILYKKIVDMLS